MTDKWYDEYHQAVARRDEEARRDRRHGYEDVFAGALILLAFLVAFAVVMVSEGLWL